MAFVLFIIPGIWLYAAWSVAVPALLIERKGAFRSLGRSRRLVKGRWWATAAVLVVATLMVTLISGAIEALLIAVASLPSQPSLLLAVFVSTLSGVIATVITEPFRAATTTLLYYDLRVRREGYDLHVLADQLGLPVLLDAGRRGRRPGGVGGSRRRRLPVRGLPDRSRIGGPAGWPAVLAPAAGLDPRPVTQGVRR